MTEQARCRLCGKVLDAADDDLADMLCADRRWDDETGGDGEVGD